MSVKTRLCSTNLAPNTNPYPDPSPDPDLNPNPGPNPNQAVIYPVYALSVLLTFVVDWWRDKALPPWYAGPGLVRDS